MDDQPYIDVPSTCGRDAFESIATPGADVRVKQAERAHSKYALAHPITYEHLDQDIGRQRNGFALPVAIFALVIIGVIITGEFFMAQQESRISVAHEQAALAFFLTDQGLVEIMSDWSPSAYSAMADWTDTTLTFHFGDTGEVSLEVTKMSDYMYFLDATGTVSQGGSRYSGASRRLGVTVRMQTVDFDPPGALTTRGSTVVGGSAEVNGDDTNPSEWGSVCDGTVLENKPGIVVDDSTLVDTSGGGTITGNPAIEQDTTISAETFTQFGDHDWDDLVSRADHVYSGGTFSSIAPDSTASGVCNSGPTYPSNWGNPTGGIGAACRDYFPIIYIGGNARIQSGGIGQGILLVQGNLNLRGNFVFYGMIIVQGSFNTGGSGNRVYGGVMAGNATFDDAAILGGSVVTNSTCAITQASLNNSSITRVRPVTSRSWVDLSGI